MKGMLKAVKRAPHQLTTKVGMGKRSNDPEYDEYARKFALMEGAMEKLLKDCKTYSEQVTTLVSSSVGFATHFAVIFEPLVGEYDLIGKHPEAADTVRNVTAYTTELEELKAQIAPELELIESRIAGPAKELHILMKQIRKGMTKREHKLVDYDRLNNSLTKLREKKEKSLNDEKNLFKLEQDFELAVNDYELYNSAMKADLPHFMTLSTQFIDPLFHSFFYMQLNIFYMIMERMQAFTTGKYEGGTSGAEILADYEANRGDAIEQVESLGITRRMASTAKLMAGRTPTASATGSVHRAPSSVSASSIASKKPPPPPPAAHNAPPPPYSAGAASKATAAATAAATKRAPPPPPALKPKPALKPQVQYVVALYDFAAQADGDLSFSTGDRIEIVERTPSTEDWWTGRINGRQGVFPGNYVQET